MIVITFLLRRRPELSAVEFHAYWRDRHGPLVASRAGALGIRRYMQLHATDSPVGAAIAESRGYKEAPVSVLLLEKRPPDLVFEKLTNTFAQRHHLRVWKRPESFDGKPTWVVAATHDTGIEFSERGFSVTPTNEAYKLAVNYFVYALTH